MKNLLTLLLVLFVVNLSLAQSKNKERLDEIDNLIEQAVEAGDYDQAAQLKKEKTIRLDIEKALADQDYDKAEELKSELERMENGQKNEAVREEKVEEKTQESNVRVAENNSEPSSEKQYIHKHGFAMDILLQFNPGYTGIGPAIQLGNKWYFGHGSFFRPGLQVLWGRIGFYGMINSVYGGGIIPTIAPVNVGFCGAFSFNNKVGIETNLSMGLILTNRPTTTYVPGGYEYDYFYDTYTYVPGYYDYDTEFGVGFNIGPAVKFRYKYLAIGIDYRAIPVHSAGAGGAGSLLSFNLGFKW